MNSYFDPGMNLLSCLLSILLTFQADVIGCQSDIRAPFHQIVIREEDRQYVQFLWNDKVLRLQRVPFGLACSPFMLLLHTVSCHLNQHPGVDPHIRRLIRRGIYMDDLCLSFSSPLEAETGMGRVRNISAAAGMDLHKERMSGAPSNNSSILGIGWNTATDQLSVTIPRRDTLPDTKSGLLSLLSAPFDPLGVLTPWLIWGKVIFQDT